MDDHKQLSRELQKHPHLARVVEGQLKALGYAIKHGETIMDRIDQVPISILTNLIDNTGYVLKSPPKVAKGFLSGAFNLVEDVFVEGVNAVCPYGKVESYGQYLRSRPQRGKYSGR